MGEMPATEYQGSSSSFPLSRSTLKHNQVHSMDSAREATSQSLELEAFQRQIRDRFFDLSAASPDSLLSLSWVCKLLDVFLCCQEEFRMILFNNQGYMKRAPMDRIISDYFERSIKALDICNAIRDGIEQIRHWQKQLEIVFCALDKQRKLNKGHFCRAKKALIDLTICMLDEKNSCSVIAHRNRSFERTNPNKEHKNLGHSRSLSWSVSRSWSAARQIQGLGNLSVPKTNEIMATNGLAAAVFTMSSVLYFVMWVLVAAIPCQDRGLQTHFNIPRQFAWVNPILLLHDRILEESKRRDRRNACGLMREIHRIEICASHMNGLTDLLQFPLTEEREGEFSERVEELGGLLEAMKEGLDPLEIRVRETFHRIVRCRTLGLDIVQ